MAGAKTSPQIGTIPQGNQPASWWRVGYTGPFHILEKGVIGPHGIHTMTDSDWPPQHLRLVYFSCTFKTLYSLPLYPIQYHFRPQNSFCGKRNAAEGTEPRYSLVLSCSHHPEVGGLEDGELWSAGGCGCQPNHIPWGSGVYYTVDS